ncbi:MULTISPECIES: aspartate-semialdehyde dehydrogenase [Aliivibrio]|uniref:Aspartate-semialdehyde dehydrogenase n=1 Tax=Aliivibrio finisterrensis TaxID=511998 RepID=A0A4Q5KT32_9GAMM|nr:MULTISPECIES: aspartate-semialdehyde dehydrogenase [Aliivibrio]MDD9178999.1 aspartate-semialdehyde dehydrogenase [Aliivibrio sp. A6]RYU50834.1 aspartate-semialdehyde dehydrogenase [Aliivibrio finisterrensis]RYU53484.1 aspartate-semialdehyde dehydrogenase [Aliivibrio finisterrensis]RYU58786.1 aspartate-semialdehyde dehydrogenase [Aliivibrio finisterrensis]RYU64987.1 aspartate-semialdehyde dehydrogenase [Aliivibrio finisterrensis]
MDFYNQVQTISQGTIESAKQNNFAGYDPFDSLNSNFFNYFPRLKKGVFGLAWIQFNKRSIVNFRPFLGVPKKRNPKGVALFLMGLLEDYQRTNDKVYLNQAIELGDWLLTRQSDAAEWKHACWGYHFDWNARAFFVPKGKPNIITTIYVSQALYALSEITKEDKYLHPALDSAHFIVKTLYKELEGRQYFAYIPGEEAFVHNASLWGAAWVAKVASLTNNNDYKELALTVAAQSVKEQQADGSWVYGARHHHQFIDGFHTGYNLEALQMLSDALQINSFDDAIIRGLQYYKTHLFEADGTAKYYNTNRYPLDMHCVSQAIFTLIKVGKTEEDLAFTKKVVSRSIDTLYLPEKKYFSYQKHHRFSNNINYIRWTQAWVYYSFSFLNNYGHSHETH